MSPAVSSGWLLCIICMTRFSVGVSLRGKSILHEPLHIRSIGTTEACGALHWQRYLDRPGRRRGAVCLTILPSVCRVRG